MGGDLSYISLLGQDLSALLNSSADWDAAPCRASTVESQATPLAHAVTRQYPHCNSTHQAQGAVQICNASSRTSLQHATLTSWLDVKPTWTTFRPDTSLLPVTNDKGRLANWATPGPPLVPSRRFQTSLSQPPAVPLALSTCRATSVLPTTMAARRFCSGNSLHHTRTPPPATNNIFCAHRADCRKWAQEYSLGSRLSAKSLRNSNVGFLE